METKGMKKLFLLLMLILSVNCFSQSGGALLNEDTKTWYDSLYYGSPGDSVWILKTTDFYASTFRIYLDGNSNNPVDSIGIELGAYKRNNAGTVTGAVWGSQIAVKDSAWNTLQTLVNKSTSKDYQLYAMPPVELMRISLLNHRGTVKTRKVKIIVQAAKM